ncbi:MAG: hypothetical protein M5R36_19505 [Deltaproteobacteria bacterium]|nr:hypothetical protein [Deltaproteobacteria bacterium]
MQRFPVPWRSLAWNTASLAMPENVPVHNDYGRMLAETGIFSLAAFIAMLTIAYRNLTYALRKLTDPYLSATASAFRLFLLAMMAYWFFHEYVMEEPFVSVLPFAFSIILKRMADRQDESDAAEAPA